MIDITGIDRGELLAALHNGTRPLGMGTMQARGLMTKADGQKYIAEYIARVGGSADRDLTFDYVFGRPVKVVFKGNTLEREQLYDRDTYEGACAKIVESLRGTDPG